MIVLGLLLLVAVAVVSVAAIARGGDNVTIDLGSFEIRTDAAGMFLAGAVALLLAVIGLWLMSRGLKRSRRRRQEIHELRTRAARNEAAHRDGDADTDADTVADQDTTLSDTDRTAVHEPTAEMRRRTNADEPIDTAPREG